MIYTTNAIENFNHQMIKSTKTKSAFISDDALTKMSYLTTIRVTEKRAQPIHKRSTVLQNLVTYFGEIIEVLC